MKAIKTNGINFSCYKEIDFSVNKIIYLVINVLSLISFAAFYIFFQSLFNFLSGNNSEGLTTSLRAFQSMPVHLLIIAMLILIFFTIVHELIHGFFFYIFTGAKPVFGFKKLSAYAGAPEWYLPKRYYLTACLSPFVFLTLAGFTVLFIIPAEFNALMLIILSAHAAGCVGDLWVGFLLMSKHAQTFINDTGMVVKIGQILK